MINHWNSCASKCRNCKDNGLNGSPIVVPYPVTGKATPASLFAGGPVRLPRVNSNGGELPPRHCNELLAAFLEHLGQVPAGVGDERNSMLSLKIEVIQLLWKGQLPEVLLCVCEFLVIPKWTLNAE